MCSPSPPPAPDYKGAAVEQGAANLDAARAQGRMNNPNVTGPTGSQTVTWQDDTPTLVQTLNPQEQAIYDSGAANRLGMSQLAGQGTTALSSLIGRNLDMSTLPAAPGSSDENRKAIMDAMVSRSNEDIDNQESRARSQMIAAGIPMGSEAYSKETTRFDRSRNDARNQAELAAGQESSRTFGMDSDRRRSALAEMLTQRQTPLNEITALMNGGQVTNPFTTPGYAQNTNVAPAPLFAGAQAQGAQDMALYNSQVGQANGLLGAGAKLGSAFMMTPSDARLKSNIKQIGYHPSGLPWYEFEIFGERQEGVMAQEVLAVNPDAVHVMDNGYFAVDYGRL